MKILGIESSCDETSASVVDGGTRVLSNIVWSQVEIHAPYGGVVPEIASRNHLRAIVPVVQQALESAGVTLDDIDGFAVTLGPGLIGSLLVGVQFAKGLALATGKPIVGVDHLEAHVMASFLGDRQPEFPFVALAVSGGHTSIYLVEDFGRMKLLGKTLDDAAGEALDKAAVALGLPYPGGVAIDRVSRGRNVSAVRFPRALIKDGLDMSFSGMKTAMRRHLELREGALDDDLVGDIAASFLESVVDVLVTKTAVAAKQNGVNDVVIAGGVAANTRLRERMAEEMASAGRRFIAADRQYCTDNAAMVAAVGYQRIFGALASAPAPRDLGMDPFVRHG